MKKQTILSMLIMPMFFDKAVLAQEEALNASDLAKKTQNPISDLISLPFQNNFNFGVGPEEDMQYILNIQPVIPFQLSEDWNLITRTIIPLIYQPSLAPSMDDEFGLGDSQLSLFFSPRDSGDFIWGFGPMFVFPTGTDEVLGTEKWSAGLTAVALRMDGPWVYGALVNNVFSYAGEGGRDDVNQMLIQPFLNYNLPGGWYLTSAPIITANWEADSDNTWTIPIGGGFGKIFKVGKQPMNAQFQAFYNVVRPDNGPDWGLRFQVQFLFPK